MADLEAWRRRYARCSALVWGLVYALIGAVASALGSSPVLAMLLFAAGGISAGYLGNRTRGRGGSMVFVACFLLPLLVSGGLQASPASVMTAGGRITLASHPGSC